MIWYGVDETVESGIQFRNNVLVEFDAKVTLGKF